MKKKTIISIILTILFSFLLGLLIAFFAEGGNFIGGTLFGFAISLGLGLMVDILCVAVGISPMFMLSWFGLF